MKQIPENYQELDEICFALDNDDVKTIVVTSAQGGEGCSSLVVSLANRYLNLNRNVLVVDLNLKDPILAQWYEMGELAPWSFADISCQLAVTEVKGLSVLSAKSLCTKVTVREHQVMRNALSRLVQEFDIVIFDTSPVNAVNKENIPPSLLAQWSDVVLACVSLNYTQDSDLARMMINLGEKNTEKVKIVITQQNMPSLAKLITAKLEKMILSTNPVTAWIGRFVMTKLRTKLSTSTWLKTNP